eukprot:Protomagalhaensia_wolfi_Nauph_80__182@NODE_10_length_5655_cov_165_650285_g7_i1_p3_GENE_NODE_10_length_5655_cov_165_650285_g7_i1NODE_10_length_5655_cov_165_650285_g7_i1_p3_ORF_typecomplete_len322_score58_78Metallophos_2/PF12850_7/1_2e07Metallophos/PF00149_28/7_5e07DNA_pol_E_B/PF04042_16/0_012Mur_ligase_C/PF02875_21/0_24_NODE_10_length_5655_cov_165_650285_g7_i139814946
MSAALKIFVISDVHTDIAENVTWIAEALETVHGEASFCILIVAGDVSDKEAALLSTFETLSRSFDVVLFTPGNHDVWVRPDEVETSLDKNIRIRRLLELRFSNVFCSPVHLSLRGSPTSSNPLSCNLAFVPILGWHSETFDLEPEIPKSELCNKDLPPLNQVISDRTRSRYCVSAILEERQAGAPSVEKTLQEQYFRILKAFNIHQENKLPIQNWDSPYIAWKLDSLNLERDEVKAPLKISRPSGCILTATQISDQVRDFFRNKASRQETFGGYDKVVAFSHFLPFPFLNPEKRYLFYPHLAKVIGSMVGSKFRLSSVSPT